MKKIITLTCVVFFTTFSFSQTRFEAISALKAEIAQINQKLPMNLGFLVLQKIQIEGNNYVSYFLIDEEQIDFDTYISDMRQYKERLFSLVGNSQKDQAELLVASEFSIKMVVSSIQTKRTETIFLPASKIKEAYQKNLYTAKDYLKDIVAEMRATLPEDWGDGLVWTSIEIENNFLCYRIKTDETYLTISLLKDCIDSTDMIDGMIEEFNTTDDLMIIILLKYLKESGMGIKYTYWSDKTAETATITLLPKDLKMKVKEREN